MLFITVCDGNTYGQDCTTSCGNCINEDQCHHVTGVCPNGCDKGVYGENCDKGNVIKVELR